MTALSIVMVIAQIEAYDLIRLLVTSISNVTNNEFQI